MNRNAYFKATVLPQITLLVLLLSGLSSPLRAQIEAPNLVCIGNDTLVWETPTVNCGPFRGYIILGSRSVDGPFSPIDTIRDQARTTFYHEEAGGATWYYYLESDFDCPGLSRLSSDTLDNRLPELGPLLSASVSGRDVILNWAPSPSPETAGYIISRNTNAGTTIIDTVYGETTYTDFNATPIEKPETYFVTAVDRCGNTSIVGNPHTTMFLESGDIDPCRQSVDIRWTPYQGWDGGPERYEILVYSNGNEPMEVGRTGGGATSYTFTNANKGEIYCFTIRAVQAGGDNSALSNTVCEAPQVVQPIRELSIRNVSFSENSDAVNVAWRWNTNAELSEAALLRSVDNGPFSPVHRIDISAGLSEENTYTDTAPLAAGASVCYRVETTDACGAAAVSDIGCAVNLTAVSDGQGGNRLTWTPFDLGQINRLNYELFRVQGGGSNAVATLNGSETEYVDQTDPAGNASGTTCYFVVASATVVLPDGSTDQIEARSNIACTQLSSKIYIPNAFAPGGVNTEFRPYLQFGDPAEYLLEVYDRWGSKVFQTAAIDEGWDGTSDGRELPAGVYIYRLFLRQSNGNSIERAGSVALIR